MNGRVEDLEAAGQRWRAALLAQREPEGYWEGELSTSALSTAVALVALHGVDKQKYQEQIQLGATWLKNNVNEDGGWGDTVRSSSNLSTTALCWGALQCCGANQTDGVRDGAQIWLRNRLGDTDPETIARAILYRYAEDRTFSVPILMMLAVTGCLGPPKQAWRHLIPLPFELAALPRRFYSLMGLPVVSYALPALIAIGQVIYHHRRPRNPLTRWLRGMAGKPTLKLLESIQPVNGGFLEATPLTAFVTISLAAMDHSQSIVVQRAVDFLLKSQRPEGGWPIDTHLATWVSTLATNGLGSSDATNDWPKEERAKLKQWLLDQQYHQVHPYTGAKPGGWAWTPLPGGVPDADDTSGALIALANLGSEEKDVRAAAYLGLKWLADLQNRDGGIPTFCKGWGKLPFDRSCPDITAHALQAFTLWRTKGVTLPKGERAIQRMAQNLVKTQHAEGYWLPQWFGNEHHPHQHNPTYGTARVLLGLAEAVNHGLKNTAVTEAIEQGKNWLLATQNQDGAWGGAQGLPPTIEETAVAVAALITLGAKQPRILAGLNWLATKDSDDPATPIGLYFASLWYYEKLYPLVWTVQAFETARTKGFLE